MILNDVTSMTVIHKSSLLVSSGQYHTSKNDSSIWSPKMRRLYPAD